MPPVTHIITNARVITMDNQRPCAEALAVAGNRIVAVGTATDVATLRGPQTLVTDARGKSVIPGIIESHVHLFMGAAELGLLNLRYAVGFDAIAAAVHAYKNQNPNLKIIHAISIAHEQFGPGVSITRQLLDRIVDDRPLIMACFDHHTVWANTKALEAAGLMRGRVLPPGNEVVLDSSGYATGELREPAAFDPVLALTATGGRDALGFTTGGNPVPPATPTQRAADIETLRKGIAHANALGITSMHNMDGNWYQLELLHDLEKRGALNARMEVPFHFKNNFKLEQIDEAVKFRDAYKSDFLHSGRVKLFIDGVLETLTAQMLEDYPGHPGNKGAPLYAPDEFAQIVTRADAHGLQIATHAIADGAVRTTLDAYEQAQRVNGKRDSRHRIEHIELIDPADIPRIAQLGVVASLQPVAGVGVPGAPLEPILSRVGNKLPYAYAWQTIRNTGAHVAFSSDWPVAPLNPFEGIQAAMTVVPLRPDCPPQAQSLMDALHGFTLAGAHMEFMEDRKGMIREGYFADIAVLDMDLEQTSPARIGQARSVLTMCDGRVVYEA